jgi:uncharacterized protein YdeI (YjbR/CyaY-like superfamily)
VAVVCGLPEAADRLAMCPFCCEPNMSKQNPSVDGYIRKNKQWQKELEALRKIVLASELVEEVKWRVPCYTFEGSNVAFIGVLKECCTLSFIKGALLKDEHQILEMPGPNTQSARVIRFTNIQEIARVQKILKEYVNQAIEVERAGLKVDFKAKRELMIPEELQLQFDEIPELKTTFHALTPGRQRAYILHFSSAKQSATRTSRIEKCMQRILEGKGLDD